MYVYTNSFHAGIPVQGNQLVLSKERINKKEKITW